MLVEMARGDPILTASTFKTRGTIGLSVCIFLICYMLCYNSWCNKDTSTLYRCHKGDEVEHISDVSTGAAEYRGSGTIP